MSSHTDDAPAQPPEAASHAPIEHTSDSRDALQHEVAGGSDTALLEATAETKVREDRPRYVVLI